MSKITETLEKDGFSISQGTATDKNNHVTTVIKATKWGKDVWVQNDFKFPDLNDPRAVEGGTPSQDEFVITIYSRLLTKDANSTYAMLRSKLVGLGYRVEERDDQCGYKS